MVGEIQAVPEASEGGPAPAVKVGDRVLFAKYVHVSTPLPLFSPSPPLSDRPVFVFCFLCAHLLGFNPIDRYGSTETTLEDTDVYFVKASELLAIVE